MQSTIREPRVDKLKSLPCFVQQTLRITRGLPRRDIIVEGDRGDAEHERRRQTHSIGLGLVMVRVVGS